MPLNLTDFNQFYIINKVCGLEKQRHYLESLGFVPGTQVTILSELHGYYVVMVKGSKIGLDKELAKKSLFTQTDYDYKIPSVKHIFLAFGG